MARQGRSFPSTPRRILSRRALAAADRYGREISRDFPIAWWRMKGNFINAVTGQDNGTGTNGPSQVDGIVAYSEFGAYSFVGSSSQFVDVTESTVPWPRLAQPRSIECWFKTSYTAGPTPLFTYGDGGAGGLSGWNVDVDGGTGRIDVNYDFGTTFDSFGSGYNDGKAHHLVITYDGTNTRCYVDGLPVGSASARTLATVINSSVWIATNGSNFATGVIDEVAVYGGALSAQRIRRHYAAGIAYAGAVIADEPIAYYRLGEASGTTAYAVIGPDGTYNNTPTLGVTGLVSGNDKAVAFSAASAEHMETGFGVMPAGSSAGASIEAWVKVASWPSPGTPWTIASWNDVYTTAHHDLRIGADASDRWVEWLYYSGTGSTTAYGTSLNSFSVGDVLHIVVTHDYEGKVVSFYVNGVSSSPSFGAPTTVAPALAAGIPLTIGKWWGNDLRPFDGTIDEVAVYDYVLTPARVGLHYAAGLTYGSAVAGDSPISYFRHEEPSGTTMVDSLEQHPGTYAGAVTLGSTGAVGKAITLAGLTTTYGKVAGWTTVPNKPITLECWAKWNGDTGVNDTSLGGWFHQSGVMACQLYVNGVGGTAGTVNLRIGTENGNANADCAMGDLGWHHVVGTIDSGGNARLYFDGALVAGPTAVTFSGGTSDNPFKIGTYGADGSHNSWEGGIDEWAVYDYALSATQVLAHYGAGFSGPQNLSRSASESISGTQAATRALVLLRSISDAPTATQAATRALAALRTAADSISATQSANEALGLNRAGADSISATQAATRALALARSTTDSISATQSATRTSSQPRSSVDAISTVDAANRTIAVARSASDAPTATQAATRTLTALRSAADAISTTSTANETLILLRAGADSISTADAATRATNTPRSTSDAISTTSTAARTLFALRAGADAIASADAATRALSLTRSSSDAPATADAATRSVTISRAGADAISAAQAATRTISLLRSIADAISTADAATQTGTRSRSASDTISTGDTAARVTSQPRSAADSTSSSDTAARTAALSRSSSDAASVSDSPSRLLSATRAAADAIAAASAASRTLALTRASAESLTSADTAVRASSLPRAASDAPSSSDAASRALAASRSSSEAVSTTSTASRALSALRTAADAITASSSASRTLAATRAAAEALAAVSAAARTLAATRSTSDSISTSESSTAISGVSVTASDSISAAQAATRALVASRAAADAVSTSDQATQSSGVLATASDSISTASSAARTILLARAATDAASTTDAATRVSSLGRSISDAVATADATTRSLGAARSAAESVSASSAAARTGLFTRAGADSISTVDVATQTIINAAVLFRSAADAIATADVSTRVQNLMRSASESLAAASSASRQLVALRSTTDAIASSDASTSNAGTSVAAADSVSTSDTATRFTLISRAAADAATLADFPSRTLIAFRQVAETIVLLDYAFRGGLISKGTVGAAWQLLADVGAAYDVLLGVGAAFEVIKAAPVEQVNGVGAAANLRDKVGAEAS